MTSEVAGARRAPRWVLVLLSAVSLLMLGLGVTSASAVEPKVVVQGRTNSSTSLDVSWSEVKGAAGYKLAYSTDAKLKKSVKTLADVQKGSDATITGLDADQTYYVQVTAVDDKGAAVGDSAVVSAKTSYPYAAPGDIYATKVTDKSMTLSWKSVGNTPGYLVETTLKGKSTTIQTTKTSVDLAGLKASTSYAVKVRAAKGTEALSDNSPSQSFSTSGFPIAAPDNFAEGKQRSTSIELSWDKVAGLSDGQGYVVEYDPKSGSFTKSTTTKTITDTSTKLTGLKTNLTYYARTWVVDAKGKRISNRSDYIVIKTLVPRGTLEGDVSGPSGDLLAVAYDKRNQMALSVPVSGGHYSLDVRPSMGPYKVQIQYVGKPATDKNDDDHNWVSTFAHTSGSGWTLSQGKKYSVDEGDKQHVDDVTVKHGNVFYGTVVKASNKKDELSNVDVTAISGVNPSKSGQERQVIGMARTDKNGQFVIAGLVDGPYWFRFHYVGSGTQYKTLSQHVDLDSNLGVTVPLAKR